MLSAFGGEEEGMERGHNMNILFISSLPYNLSKMGTKVRWHFQHSFKLIEMILSHSTVKSLQF